MSSKSSVGSRSYRWRVWNRRFKDKLTAMSHAAKVGGRVYDTLNRRYVEDSHV